MVGWDLKKCKRKLSTKISYACRGRFIFLQYLYTISVPPELKMNLDYVNSFNFINNTDTSWNLK